MLSKSFIFLVKSFLVNFYRHLAIFFWSHWSGHTAVQSSIQIYANFRRRHSITTYFGLKSITLPGNPLHFWSTSSSAFPVSAFTIATSVMTRASTKARTQPPTTPTPTIAAATTPTTTAAAATTITYAASSTWTAVTSSSIQTQRL